MIRTTRITRQWLFAYGVRIVVLLLIVGSLKATLVPVNGGFETGDLTGWTVGGTVGNVQVLSQLGPYGAPGGSFFAFLSNGPGQINDPAVAQDSTSLSTANSYLISHGMLFSFALDFLSAEPNDGSGFPDYYTVKAMTSSATLLLLSGIITSGQAPIPGGPITAPDGTTVAYHDGLRTFNIGLDQLAGQNVAFQFAVFDALGDNTFDSALMVDNVTLTQGSVPSPVPEPTSAVLLATALTSILMLRRNAFGVKSVLRVWKC